MKEQVLRLFRDGHSSRLDGNEAAVSAQALERVPAAAKERRAGLGVTLGEQPAGRGMGRDCARPRPPNGRGGLCCWAQGGAWPSPFGRGDAPLTTPNVSRAPGEPLTGVTRNVLEDGK